MPDTTTTDATTTATRRVDDALTRALGEELRRAREHAELSQLQVVEAMPDRPHPKTYASYEQGARQCTVVRLYWMAAALGISPLDLLARADRRASTDLTTTTVDVDLAALAADPDELAVLRRWARDRMTIHPATVARLTGDAVQEMALILRLPVTDLHRRFARFAPS